MSTVHFLNVRNGDCSIIQHNNQSHVTVIDVNCAKKPVVEKSASVMLSRMAEARNAVRGNFNMKDYPTNPIEYLRKISVSSIFRFILTHPDLDHIGGITDLFEEFNPINFWDTANTKELDPESFGTRTELRRYWQFYKNLRDTSPEVSPKRLVLHSGDSRDFWPADGIEILAPTPLLVALGNIKEDWNDSSYVILYRSGGKKILFAGDSEDDTWEHILGNASHKASVSNLDVLIAPHHGRDSGRSYDFLTVTKPKLTLFGNASSDHLGYDAWNNRDLPFITNNQAGYVVLDVDKTGVGVYVENEVFARAYVEENDLFTYESSAFNAWYLFRNA